MRLYHAIAPLLIAVALLVTSLPAARAQSENPIYLPQISTPLPTVVLALYNSAGRTVLYSQRANGYGLTQMTFPERGHGDNTSPHWSPAGDRLAFLSNRDGAWRIYLMRPDGSQHFRPTNTPGPDEALVGWSPNGWHLLFSRGAQLFTIDADGGGEFPMPSQATHASWGPNSTQLLYSTPAGNQLGGNLYRINLDRTGQQLITTTTGLTITDVLWSPDGERIALGVNNDSPGIPGSGRHDYLITDTNGNLTAVLPGAFSATWSPDGMRIAYSTLAQLIVADRDGANKQTVARVAEPNVLGDVIRAGEWSRDGTWVGYRVSNRTIQRVGIARRDGSERPDLMPWPEPALKVFDLTWGL